MGARLGEEAAERAAFFRVGGIRAFDLFDVHTIAKEREALGNGGGIERAELFLYGFGGDGMERQHDSLYMCLGKREHDAHIYRLAKRARESGKCCVATSCGVLSCPQNTQKSLFGTCPPVHIGFVHTAQGGTGAEWQSLRRCLFDDLTEGEEAGKERLGGEGVLDGVVDDGAERVQGGVAGSALFGG